MSSSTSIRKGAHSTSSNDDGGGGGHWRPPMVVVRAWAAEEAAERRPSLNKSGANGCVAFLSHGHQFGSRRSSFRRRFILWNCQPTARPPPLSVARNFEVPITTRIESAKLSGRAQQQQINKNHAPRWPHRHLRPPPSRRPHRRLHRFSRLRHHGSIFSRRTTLRSHR